MKVIDMFSGSEKMVNEDKIWYSDKCAFVLDGSTSLNGSGYPLSVFLQSFINEFSALIEKTGSLCQTVNETISSIKEDNSSGVKPNALQIFPSAAGVFAYETDTEIQLLTIGDCTAILFGNFGTKKIYSNEVDFFDHKVIRRMTELQQLTGADICDIVLSDEIKDMLIENRKMMNRSGGYRIISLNMKPVTEKDIISIKKPDVEKIILYSDGFELLEEDIISGKTEFYLLYQKLRKIEQADSRLNAYPRFKQSDDASIISLLISD